MCGVAETQQTNRSRATSAFIVIACVCSLFEVAGFAVAALGLLVAYERTKEACVVGVLAVLAITLPAYAFVPVVGGRGGYFGAACLGYVVCVLLALVQPLLALAVTHRLTRTLATRAVVFPIAWALTAELVPQVFPFRVSYLALTTLPLAQWLSVGGPVVLDVMTLGLGTAVVLVVRGTPGTRVAAVTYLALVVFGGHVMLARARGERVPTFAVGIVSPAIALESGRDAEGRGARLAALHALSDSVAEASLVVWPESTYPHRVRVEQALDVPGLGGIRPEGARAAYLVGAAVGDDPCATFSSFVAVDRRGRVAGRIDKSRLMPFGDVVPLRALGFVRARFPCGTREGERAHAIDLEGVRIGGLVCFDEVFPDIARARVREGASLLVSGANDAWYAGTFEPALHARVARARAIETRRDLVRAVNMGEGGLVASTGEVLVRMDGTRPEARLVRAAPQTKQTIAMWLGPAVAPGFAFVLMLFAASNVISRRRAAAVVAP